MWKDIHTITDHKPTLKTLSSNSALLPDELKHFYACLKQGSRPHTTNGDHSIIDHSLFSTAGVHSAQSRVHTCKAADPDGIPSCVLRACARQLTWVFTDIFSLSLNQAVNDTTCLKTYWCLSILLQHS